MNQTTLKFCDPLIPVAERPRLAKQTQAIVDRLRRSDATNDELAQIARKYTSRISDARKSGYTINVVSRDHATGVVVYRLEG